MPRIRNFALRLSRAYSRRSEEEFARFAGTEAALYFASGYAANVGLLTSLLQKDDLVFSDAHNHASLIDGIRLSGARKIIYPHLDLDALETALRARSRESVRKIIIIETVFSMDGNVAPLAALLELCERYGAALIVDEAHATGVHGPGGRGILAQSGDPGRVLAATYTCGKALASAGAFVCGSSILKEHLINNARTFLFTTAMPPYMAAQIRAALQIMQSMDEQREQLLNRSRQLVTGLQKMSYHTAGSCTQIVPVLLGSNHQAIAAAAFLQDLGFAVRAIRPPTVPEGSARLRFSVTAAISSQDLQRLEAAMGSWAAHHQERVMAGTDTGVGKTTLAALLCAALDAVYWKPIQTGTLEGSDRVSVMRLAGIGTDRTLDEVYKFVPPVSPDLAARWAGTEIDLTRINLPSSVQNDWLVVEGAGGVLVPINQKQFMLDMMVKFMLPVILAARSGMGTINHTLLTLAALHAAELPVHGVVLIGDQNRENRETIERFGHVRVIGEIPRLPNLHRTALMQVFMNNFDRAAFAQ